MNCKVLGCLLLFILWIPPVFSAELEGLAGVTYTGFDGSLSEYDSYGISARLKYNWHKEEPGLFAMGIFSGENLIIGDFLFGYRWISSSELKFETGLFAAYSVIYGPGFGALVGPRWDLNSKFYISLPVIYRSSSYLGAAPMMGYKF